MEIIIIKLGAVGDVLRTTSILQPLKEKYKDAKISWITKKESIGLLENNIYADKLYSLEDLKLDDLAKKKYDLVISLDDNKEACEIATRLKKGKIMGSYLEGGKQKYTADSSLWFDMGLISRYGKQKADKLKAENKKTYQQIMHELLGLEYKKQEPILVLNKGELSFGEKFAAENNIKNNNLVVGINTGAGGRWQDKKLGIEETAELIDKLNKELKDKNAKLLLFGGPEEKERNEKIKEIVKTKSIDAGCNNSVKEFAALVNLCNVLVTSDSLALHIGVALKKKVVAFFYPTSSQEIELYGRGLKIIGKGKSYCSYQTKCDIPPKWDIDEIVSAVKNLV